MCMAYSTTISSKIIKINDGTDERGKSIFCGSLLELLGKYHIVPR